MSTKVRMLFLDDNVNRHKLLLSWFQGADHCYGYADCVKLLSDNRYDVVSLDHDLGEDDDYCIPDVTNKSPTGTDVARFIAKIAKKPKIAILHSYNPGGAAVMAAILKDAGVGVMTVPFGFNPDVYKKLALETR